VTTRVVLEHTAPSDVVKISAAPLFQLLAASAVPPDRPRINVGEPHEQDKHPQSDEHEGNDSVTISTGRRTQQGVLDHPACHQAPCGGENGENHAR
jgi:hypothetical protein